jgi:hypothetical protein
LTEKLSQFSLRHKSPAEDPLGAFAILRGALSGDAFTFIADGREIESGLAEAAALSLLVREQLSVDACARKLAVNGGAVGAAFASLWRILSGGRISADESVALVGGLLSNPAVVRLSVRAPLRADDLSGLSVNAVDGLLSGETFRVESEDALLDCLLKLGPAYSPLLSHIQPNVLSPSGLLALLDHLARPPESIGYPTPSVATRNLPNKKGFQLSCFVSSPDVVSIGVDTFLQSVHPLEKNCIQYVPRNFCQSDADADKKHRLALCPISHQLSFHVTEKEEVRWCQNW